MAISASTAILAHGSAVPSTGAAELVVRWAVLLLAAGAVGWLLRRRSTRWALAPAVVGGVVATTAPTRVLAGVTVVHRSAVSMWLGAVLAALLGRRDRAVAAVGVGAAAATAGSGLVLARLDRVGLDTVPFDLVVLAKVGLLALAVWFGLRRARRLELGVLAAAAVAGSLLPGVASPPPGATSLVSAAGAFRVTVTPHRPGANWVHVDSEQPVQVDGAWSQRLPGTPGQWARVTLAPGRTSVEVAGKDVLVDARSRDVVQPDGPECASALLAADLAGRSLSACPAARLDPADASALRGLATWLQRRGQAPRVVGDASPRSQAAAAVLPAGGTGAVLLTGTWESAYRALERRGTRPPAGGVYLAPWLATATVLGRFSTAAPLTVLPFDPASPGVRAYLRALPPGEQPTPAGYAAFGGRGGPPRVFATSPVGILPTSLDTPHEKVGWFPAGALTPVSGHI